MKKKKGFTLVELLAVIVILAIIALIAVPIILNMIKTAKKKAAVSAAYGYIDAIEYSISLSDIKDDLAARGILGNMKLTIPNKKLDTEIPAVNLPDNTTEKPSYTVAEIEAAGVKVKGQKPSSGTVVIEKRKVKQANIEIGGYRVAYDGKKAEIEGKSSSNESTTPTYTAYSIGQSINYNPVDNAACTTPISTTGTKTGCMKWYVIKESGTSDSTVDVILDHNTTATAAYETSGSYKEYAQASIKTTVDTDTTGWTSGLNPRLITADEVAHITGADTAKSWTSATKTSSAWFYFDSNDQTERASGSVSQGTSDYKWLFDYTSDCTLYGCDTADSSTTGYWTSSPVSDTSDCAWSVYYRGYLYGSSVDRDDLSGVRPVITISKSQISS